MSSNHHQIKSPEHLQEILSLDLGAVSVLYFRADWAQPCEQMDVVIENLAKRWTDVVFLSIEAEALPDISESFEVDAVPYFILLRGHTLLTRLSGAQPAVLSAALTSHASKAKSLSTTNQKPQALSSTYTASSSDSVINEEDDAALEKRCEELMKADDVVLFMKGDRDTPRCGFSQKIIGILNDQGIEYSTFDILDDDSVRQKLKVMNDWPTFPQLIIKGEFMGGLDVVNEMVATGELTQVLTSTE